jgi:hypothetical protein
VKENSFSVSKNELFPIDIFLDFLFENPNQHERMRTILADLLDN